MPVVVKGDGPDGLILFGHGVKVHRHTPKLPLGIGLAGLGKELLGVAGRL